MTDPVALIDQLVRGLERAHRRYHSQLRLELALALESSRAYAAPAVSELAIKVGQARIAAFGEICGGESGIFFAADEVAQQASIDLARDGLRFDEELAQSVSTVVMSAAAEASSMIEDGLRLDASTTVGALRKLQVKGAMISAGGIRPAIAFNMAKDRDVSQLRFARSDRLGRQWDCALHTRTTARGALVAAYVQTYAMGLLANGVTQAGVQTDQGLVVFSLIDGAQPSLASLWGEHFHPNAQRLIQRV